MFDEKIKEEYRSIKAPEELYERIMNAESSDNKNNIVSIRKTLSVAAVLAVVILASLFFYKGNSVPEIYMGAERLTGEVSVTQNSGDGISLARAINEISCVLTFDLKTDTKFILSDGFLSDGENSVILEKNEEENFNGRFSCKWVIPMADEAETYEIRLTDKKGTYFVNLYFDGQEKAWTACLTK